MSYDIRLIDPVTKERVYVDEPHFMTGGTYAAGGTKELWLNITYNYSHYYYEAAEGDERFLYIDPYDAERRSVACNGGIRGIYGKTGWESLPMLYDMIDRIREKYTDEQGAWIYSDRTETIYYDEHNNTLNHYDVLRLALKGVDIVARREEKPVKVWEGSSSDYWSDTAANAIIPLYKLIAMAQMRPDCIWEGD